MSFFLQKFLQRARSFENYHNRVFIYRGSTQIKFRIKGLPLRPSRKKGSDTKFRDPIKMSAKKRILFIANEMSPYLELTEFSEIVNRLAIKSNDSGFEVRCIMPRFGIINERRHRLHEVVRLSGINVSVDNDDLPLQIKVASLPSARLQVYFLDNEDLFRRKYVFNDEQEKWYDDNGLRTVFFCKGALETVKKFGWPPDIIHCSGWMTGLIPAYLKTLYKKEPVFAHSKVIYTVGQNTFKEKLGSDFIKKALIHPSLKEKDLEVYKE